MKRFVSILLVSVMLSAMIAVGTMSASAAIMINHYLYGDVDADDDVTTIDVTLIQRYDCGMVDFDKVAQVAADFDHDDDITVIDVTWMQRFLADIDIPDTMGGEFSDQNMVTDFYGTYCSGKTMTNVPVTYTVEAECGTQIVDYTFTVLSWNYKEVYATQSSTDPHFTYAFSEPGYYVVSVCCTDKLNLRDLRTRYYDAQIEVVAPYSIKDPVINNYYADSIYTPNELTVGAIGGKAPYQYCFSANVYTDYESYEDLYWKSTAYENGELYLTTGYIDSETVTLLPWDLTKESWGHYTIVVTARDSNGIESEPMIIDAPENVIEG